MAKKANSVPKLTATQLNNLADSVSAALAASGRAHAALADRVAPEILARLERLAREHEAAFLRDLAELKDSLDLAGDYEADTGLSRDKDRGIGHRGFPQPGNHAGFSMPHEELFAGLPRNTDAAAPRNAGPSESGGARELGAAARPSTNPRDWADGLASQDSIPGYEYSEHDLGNNTTQRVWHYDDGSFVEQVIVNGGSVQVTTSQSYDAATGTQSGGVEIYDENGLVIHTTYHANPDGSTSGSTTVRDGGIYTTYIWSKEAGSDTTEGHTEKTSGEDIKKDIATLPGTESGTDSELARWFARKFDHSRKAGPPVVTYVNPGDPDYAPNAGGPRLKPGKGIIDVHREQARPVSRGRLERWKKKLLDKVGGKINPPGPGEPGGTG